MPYRRLPKTDQARLRALRQAVTRAAEAEYNDQAVNYRTLTEAQRFLRLFADTTERYYANVDNNVSENKRYRHKVHTARMYISHFIQVLNLAVARGEIKRAQKALYQLDADSMNLPDLSTDESLVQWGKNIIEGERKRVAQGGFPIYNPAINKVQVHYDIFCEHYAARSAHRQTHSTAYADLEAMRTKADVLLLEIWNQVEAFYARELPYARLCKCQDYGLVYYYRKGEKTLTEATDKEIIKRESVQTCLRWSEMEE